MDVLKLTDIIRETSFAIHNYLRNGYLEKVYENALAHRLRKLGLKVEQQYVLKVYDEDGTVIGEYCADLFIEGCIMAELKACKELAPEHIAQLFNYLKTSRVKHGVLINFGAPKFQIKKFAL